MTVWEGVSLLIRPWLNQNGQTNRMSIRTALEASANNHLYREPLWRALFIPNDPRGLNQVRDHRKRKTRLAQVLKVRNGVISILQGVHDELAVGGY